MPDRDIRLQAQRQGGVFAQGPVRKAIASAKIQQSSRHLQPHHMFTILIRYLSQSNLRKMEPLDELSRSNFGHEGFLQATQREAHQLERG